MALTALRASRKRLARLMRAGGIEGVHQRRHGKKTTRQAAGHAPAPIWAAGS